MKIRISTLFLLALLLVSIVPLSAQDSECDDGFRLVEHFMDSTCVPDHPQRVVVLDTGELDGALSLGITPVGAVEAIPGFGLPAYLSEMTSDIEIVGSISEPNLESILLLEPDLILSNALRHEAIYDELSAIAPTVFTETVGVVWKDNLPIYADALNRQDALAIRFAEYQSRINVIREVVPVAETAVSIVRFVPGQNRVMQRGSFIGTVIDDIGFARPESQQGEDFMITVSEEQIDLMDGDVIFVSVFGDPADTELDAFTNNALWQTLTAVQEDAVYRISDDHWFLGIGFLGANRVLDDILITLSNNS
ncbi:MAG: iron-siderophore ABC transporter substrate-binding protein [Chloroflexota bacterium]